MDKKNKQTDEQTEWFLYTPLNFVHGGIIRKDHIYFQSDVNEV